MKPAPPIPALLLATCAVLWASSATAAVVEVSRSPFSPNSRIVESGIESTEAIASIRLTGGQGVAAVHGFVLTTSGTADWVQDLHDVNGVSLVVDNGDGVFDPGDYVIWEGAGSANEVNCSLVAPLFVSAGSMLDVWVVLRRKPSAGTLFGETFVVAIDAPEDVQVGGTDTVILGVPAPASSEFKVADFHVSSISPTKGNRAYLVVEGFGFSLPFSMTVGGYPCGGVAVIEDNGKRVVGLKVAFIENEFRDQPIRITTGQVNDYLTGFTYTDVGDRGLNGQSLSRVFGCVAYNAAEDRTGAAALPVMILLFLAALVRTRRRSNGRSVWAA